MIIRPGQVADANVIRLDELGRVVYSPAIEKLLAAARALYETTEPTGVGWKVSKDTFREFELALRAVDAEERRMPRVP